MGAHPIFDESLEYRIRSLMESFPEFGGKGDR
jgi:hypothetical protein